METQYKYLRIFRDGEHIQTVTYQKTANGWQATHFDRDKYMPFRLYDSLDAQRHALKVGGLTWKWNG